MIRLHVKSVGAFLTIAASLVRLCSAQAHEFWVEPDRFVVSPGDKISIDLKVGQHLSGASFPFLTNRFLAFKVGNRGKFSEIKGNQGDTPAASVAVDGSGLKVFAYHSTADRLHYTSFDQFIAYAELEGNEWAVEDHRRRNIPQDNFDELYTRCAKALVQSGVATAADGDVTVGLPFELVAEANPFRLGQKAELSVLLLWRGKPLPAAQITIFQQSGAVREARVRTDLNGRALIPLADGGKFLLSAVHLGAPTNGSDAQWESYWASLTFQVPVPDK